MAQRYIPNDLPAQSLAQQPLELMKLSLEHVLKNTPPQRTHDKEAQGGLFMGYTSISYLFFQLAALYPDLQVQDHDLLHWAKQYLDGDRGELTLDAGICGSISEKLAYEALRACISKEESDVLAFLSNIPALLGPYPAPEQDPFESELLYGRAGALYLMRLIRHWVPSSAASLEGPISQLSEKIITSRKDGDDGSWEWHGEEYFGAGHGDIGIITQLVLTTPSLAPRLAGKLQTLLDLQVDGNWPKTRKALDQGDTSGLVQWCHGAPGFICSLQALRLFFPDLQDRIDAAIVKAQEVVWKRGLLRKEPNLCHGIFGNALSLPHGPQREHFLALATVEAVEDAKKKDPEVFTPAAYGQDTAMTFNYHTSAAWTWAVCEQEEPPIIPFTDV